MTGCKGLGIALFGWLLLGPVPAWADERATGFLNRVHRGADGKEAKYALFVPHEYKGERPYPLILFLHGAGEWGTDGQKQVTVGLGPAVRKREKTFPFLVIFPQSQKKTWPIDVNDREQLRDILVTWSEQNAEGKRALAMLAEVEKEFKVDTERVYLTGLSMGGFGTWSLAASHPDRWAAIVPICGGGDPRTAGKIKQLPCWCFHGDADTAVPVDRSREMIKALWAAGAHPNYTEYPGIGHNSWDKAYDTEDLFEWLLKHRLKKRL
jgi:predicted peptidase